jgi:hypothetical protein
MGYLRGSLLPSEPPPNLGGGTAEPSPWGRVKHLFHGWDGSVWDVTDGRDGVFLMPEGIEGMGMPEIENYTFSSPVVHGVEWEGWRASGRDCHFVVGIFEDSSVEWLQMKKAFWKIFRPGKTIRWEIILPNSERYNITMRFKEDGSSVYARDPVRLGWAIYGITCMVEQPFWEGEPVEFTFENPGSGPDDFFGDSGVGPPFYISSSSGATIDTATLNNPGDVETYAKWTAYGPFTTATVGIGDYTIDLPETFADDVIVIDTDPRNLTAELNGVDIMKSLGFFDFAEIPPGEDIVLALGMNGTGKIVASFTPLYLRSI